MQAETSRYEASYACSPFDTSQVVRHRQLETWQVKWLRNGITCRAAPLPSRLGPSRTAAQTTPPHLRIQYLDSAPAVQSPAAYPVASSSQMRSRPYKQPRRPLDNSTESPDSHSLMHAAFDSAGNALLDNGDVQELDGSPSSAAATPHTWDGTQPGGRQQDHMNDAALDHQSASAEMVESPDAGVPQQHGMNSLKHSAMKRLAAKRAALNSFSSPVSMSRSPAQAALRHTTLGGKHMILGGKHCPCRSYPCNAFYTNLKNQHQLVLLHHNSLLAFTYLCSWAHLIVSAVKHLLHPYAGDWRAPISSQLWLCATPCMCTMLAPDGL